MHGIPAVHIIHLIKTTWGWEVMTQLTDTKANITMLKTLSSGRLSLESQGLYTSYCRIAGSTLYHFHYIYWTFLDI